MPVPAADALTTAAHALAVARWGVEPCSGQVAVTWAHMGGGINARSQWMSIDIHNPATYSQCSIAYNLDVDWDWPKLCTVIEHELGHLAGHEHVNDPHDVMSPYYVFPSPECADRAAWRPAGAGACSRRSDAGRDESGQRDLEAQGRQAQGRQAQGRQAQGRQAQDRERQDVSQEREGARGGRQEEEGRARPRAGGSRRTRARQLVLRLERPAPDDGHADVDRGRPGEAVRGRGLRVLGIHVDAT